MSGKYDDDTNTHAPISHFSWGRYIIFGNEHADAENGKIGAGKDIRIVHQQVSKWKERKGHLLTEAMITGIYGQDIETLIIGIGVHGALACPERVLQSIRENGVNEVILALTPDACELFNALYHQRKRVALLAHGTC